MTVDTLWRLSLGTSRHAHKHCTTHTLTKVPAFAGWLPFDVDDTHTRDGPGESNPHTFNNNKTREMDNNALTVAAMQSAIPKSVSVVRLVTMSWVVLESNQRRSLRRRRCRCRRLEPLGSFPALGASFHIEPGLFAIPQLTHYQRSLYLQLAEPIAMS